MPLIRNIEDPRFAKLLDGLNRRNQYIRELASVILPQNDGFESVLNLANRVYDRHCSRHAEMLNCHPFEQSEQTALSA
jgi:hypothetical protein